MTTSPAFSGFSPEGLAFLRDLAANNNRDWFAANRAAYEIKLLAPARDFVVALGTRLQVIAPGLRVDPRADGAGVLMRLHRDTRFAADKSPFKTELSGLFWDGLGKKTERPAFGFRLTAVGMDLMTGLFAFPPPLLDAPPRGYPAAILDDRRGAALEEALAAIQAAGPYATGGEQSRRVPAGFAADHPRAALLRYRGLYATPPRLAADQLTTGAVVERCLDHFGKLAPLYRWLATLAEPGNGAADPRGRTKGRR